MYLENIILCEKRLLRKNKYYIYFHLDVEPKKKKNHRNRKNGGCHGLGKWGKWGETGQRVQIFSYEMSSKDLIHTVVTIVNNSVLYT